MQTRLRMLDALELPVWSAQGRLRIVIAYEDLDSGHQVKEVTNRLSQVMGPDLDIECTMWKFNFLEIAALQRMAIVDAREADIVIVANGESCELPAGVRAWIDQWLKSRADRPYALVSLKTADIESPEEDGFSPTCYLKNLARRSGVDFFSEQSRWREDQFQCAIQVVHRCERDRSAAAQGGAEHPITRRHSSWKPSASEN